MVEKNGKVTLQEKHMRYERYLWPSSKNTMGQRRLILGGAKNDFLDPAISLPNKPELQIATQLLGFYPFFFMRDAFKK